MMERNFLVLIVLAVLLGGGYFVATSIFTDPQVDDNVEVSDDPLPVVDEPDRTNAPGKSAASMARPASATENVPAQVGPANQLMGRVTSTEGKPLADAELTLFRYEFVQPARTGRIRSTHREVEHESVRSDADGNYLFGDLSSAGGLTFSMRVEKDGYSEIIKDAVGAGMVVDAVLEPGKLIRGRIVDSATGKPVSGVFCDFSHMDAGRTKHDYRRWRRRFTARDDGTFEVRGAPAGPLTIYFEHGAYQWNLIKPDDVFWASADRENLEIQLVPGLKLDGKVIDERTGDVINKCEVTLKEYIIPTRREVTGVFGKFGFVGLNVGRFELSFHADGYTQRTVMLDVTREALAGEKVFKLKPAGFASGVVRDADGIALPGAEIFVAEAIDIFRKVRAPAETRSDNDGLFTVDKLDDGRTYRIAAFSEGLCVGVSVDFKAVSGEFFDGVMIKLEKGMTMRGQVHDEDGIPVKGVSVTLEVPPFRDAWFPPGMQRGQKTTLSLETDQNGYWEFGGLWPGIYELAMTHAAYVPMPPAQVRVDKYNGVIEQPVTLVKGRTISGIVLDETGAPAAGALVTASVGRFRARAVSTRTRDDGTFELVQLLDKDYRVKAMGPKGIAVVRNDVPAGSSGVDFTLQAYGSVEGAVMAHQASTPVDRFRIRVKPLHDVPRDEKGKPDVYSRVAQRLIATNESYVDRVIVAPDGRFSIMNLEPGEYMVEVEAEDRVPMTHMVTVQPGSMTTSKVFVLRSGARLEGYLTDTEGRPIQANMVKVRIVPSPNTTLETTVGPDGRRAVQHARMPWEPRELTLDKDGLYSAGGLPPGKAQIQITSSAYCCPAFEDVTLGTEGVVRRDYPLVRGAKVVLQVVDLDGVEVSVPSAAVFNADGTSAKVDGRRVSVSGGVNGQLTIPKLEPGSYVVEVKKFGYKHQRVSIEVVAGEQKIDTVKIEKLR